MKTEDGVIVHCNTLEKTVTIPDGVKQIGDWAFSDTEQRETRRSSAFEVRGERTLERILLPQSLKVIGKGAFHKEDHLKEVVFPDALEEIGELAFAGCSSLTEVILPETIRTVFPKVFMGCESLTRAILPKTMNGYTAGKSSAFCISEGLFSHCSALKEVTIPAGTKIIGKEAFWNCAALTEINIPESVEEIGDRAFDCCTSLREIRLPNSLVKMGHDALPRGEHSKLDRILIAPENIAYCTVDGVLYSKDMKTLILCPVNYANTVFAVPEGVEEIAPCAFQGCKKIRKVVFPNSVTKIGEEAFSRMYSLKTVVLPASLNELGKEVFAYCVKLNDVQWPKGPFSIGEGCFRQTGFEIITLPDTVASVGNYAFASNPYKSVGVISDRRERSRAKLEKVYLPKSVKSIGLSAFYGAREIEVYDTIDPEAKPAEEYIEPVNGGFNSNLGGAGIYLSDGYLPAACNSNWYDHVIAVRSSVENTIKYRVRMPDGQKRKVYCTFASAWGRNGGFNFKAIDKLFEDLTPDAKLDYAMDRLRYQEGITEDFQAQLIEYVSKRSKAAITKILENDSTEDLAHFSQYGIIKKRALSDYIKLAHEMEAKQSEQWLEEWHG